MGASAVGVMPQSSVFRLVRGLALCCFRFWVSLPHVWSESDGFFAPLLFWSVEFVLWFS